MKLSRLVLLIPMVFTLGCKKQNFKPNDPGDDITVISEEEFNAIFHDYKLFLEDNVVIKSLISHYPGEAFYFEADHGDMKYYAEKDSELEQRYIYLDGTKGFDIIAYDKNSSGWFVNEHHDNYRDLTIVLFNQAMFAPLDYSDLVRDEDRKIYKIPASIITVGEMSVLFKNAELSFYDGKPTSINFEFQPTDSPSDAGSGSQTFTYGSAKIVNPK